MKLRWSALAMTELTHSVARIAEDDIPAAIRVRNRIHDAAQALTLYPLMGRPGRLTNTRELVVPGLPYFIVYHATKSEVSILRVLHGAQSWP
ncbi:type II toxin-antitoxin system RelE/ParE family toxin [Maricaulis sp.]|uniref:type II toxin-antitoxin system RelE/ParE family toxin n=1 Tax=Maricaulis sp. TaxID=1486257 RepID=UPI003A909CBC